METEKKELHKRVGAELASKYNALLRVRERANWGRKQLTCSYMHHRDDYDGTTIVKRTTYDSTAISAFESFRDGYVGYLMPRDDEWGALTSPYDRKGGGYRGAFELDSIPGLMKRLEKMTSAVFTKYAQSNYYKAMTEMVTDYLQIGNGYIMAVDDWRHKDVYYQVFDPQEIVIADDSSQHLEVLVRHFRMDATDVVRAYPNAELETVRKASHSATAEDKDIEMYEAFLPSDYLWDPVEESAFDFNVGKAFVHLIYCVADEELVSISGFDEMPVCMACRNHNNSATPYGTGMAEGALDEIVKLDNMSMLRQEQFQKNVRPPWYLPYAMKSAKFSSRPDYKNFGPDMSQKPQPLMDGSNYSEMLNDIEDERRQIKEMFQIDLFKTLMSNNDSRKTAYEVSQLKNESMTLLAMNIGNLHKDVIEPIFKRTLKILARNTELAREGLLREFDMFVDMLSLELNSVFVRRLQSYLQYESILVTQQFLATAGQMFPDALVNLDTDAFIRMGAVACGAPRAFIREKDEVEKIKAERAQMLQQQREMELQGQQAQANLANSKAIAEQLPAPGGMIDDIPRR